MPRQGRFWPLTQYGMPDKISARLWAQSDFRPGRSISAPRLASLLTRVAVNLDMDSPTLNRVKKGAVVTRTILITVLFSWAAFAQSDRGAITGSVTDALGAAIVNSPVTATNPATGTGVKTMTTDTGNFTIPNLPSGVYDLAIEATGFKRYEQKGIRVEVAQTARVDVQLQLGSTTESVTVTADAPLLKTENAAQTTTVGRDTLNSMPLNFAIGAGAIRNPLTFVQLAPGAAISGWNDIKVNGAPLKTFKIIFDGQDMTATLDARVSDELQPSVDAIEEFTLQSSNFSAEFGQVGGGLFNFTSRSGTNELHGSVYEYLANEALNAGIPFTDKGNNEHVRGRVRRNDYGGSVGGPVRIPKLYDGRNRTFFFFNIERYADRQVQAGGYGTVPTEAYRNGDFSVALTGRNLGTDGLGRPILENTIYDPATAYTGPDGRIYRDPFPNNKVPQTRMDPVALKIQTLIPTPTNGALTNNFELRKKIRKLQTIPSVKIDHNLNDRQRLSVYWSEQLTNKDNGVDGLPDPISARRDQTIRSHTIRTNYDLTLTPTLLLHLGAGYQRYDNPDTSPPASTEYDAAKELGLKGQFGTGFPRLTGLGSGTGGMGIDMGPTNRQRYYTDKVTGVASATWIVRSHSIKWGGEYALSSFTNRGTIGVPGNIGFSAVQTGLPALQGVALPGGGVGFPYASFLLGMSNSGSMGNPQDPQYRKYSLGLFVQDTWKLTRKLTVDYGLRWDYQPAPRELWDRTSMFDPNIKNPSAGGLPGATLYAGQGPGRCSCDITKTYPWGFGPRLGLAYQLDSKTVFRAGAGVSYTATSAFNYIGGGNSIGMGFNSLGFGTTTFGDPAFLLRNGFVYDMNDLLKASYDPGIRPQPGQVNSPPAWVDINGGRPARLFSWNIAIQREVIRNLSIEAAYVGNRGAWFQADALNDFNGLTEQRLKSFGLNIHNADDRALLTSRMNSAAVIARGFKVPYAGFPVTATLAQSLRPFPQFGGLGSLWAPLGNTWYDSLQIKGTKRYSHGLDITASYTWSKNLTTTEDPGTAVPLNDVYNRDNQKTLSNRDQPHVFVVGFNYVTPQVRRNTFTKLALSNWTLGGVLRYASGFPIRIPGANNALGSILMRGTYANRVPGEPLFLKDLNCRSCIDPYKDLVLNPKAWSDPAQGDWGYSAVYYGDYRYARRPDEQLSIGKQFRFKERIGFSVRAEFFNVFNRTYLNNPVSGNAMQTTVYDKNGRLTNGFGYINPASVYTAPRSGQIVARFQF